MIEKLHIDRFLALSETCLVLDVRSPGEFAHAHIPGAHNLPLFNDDERAVVGTAYKQQSREDAVKIGLDYFGPKMRPMVEQVESLLNTRLLTGKNENRPILVHCWRGGMRSAGVAWLLNLYGFKVCTLHDGYKAFRTWVLEQFEKPYSLNIIGGYTGSGKTDLLREMARSGLHQIDLEGIARHKGSAFGGFGTVQPTQEMFENELAIALHSVAGKVKPGERIWLEDESQRIGSINLPAGLWNQMRESPVYFVDAPFEARLNYIVAGYSKHKKEELVNAIIRIQKRLGSQNTKNAINFLLENDFQQCFTVLLQYYDKFYSRSFETRPEDKRAIYRIQVTDVAASQNLAHLLALLQDKPQVSA